MTERRRQELAGRGRRASAEGSPRGLVVALAVAVVALAGRGIVAQPPPAPGSTPASTPATNAPAAADAVVPGKPANGFLFSAIPLSGTPLARAWSAWRAEALATFPHLELTLPEDLHVTVVYVGPWSREVLPALRTQALVRPTSEVHLSPAVARFGRDGQALVVELEAATPDWPNAVVAAKAELNRLGLKRPDRYDESFRPHVTLAEARRGEPTEETRADLAACERWLRERLAADASAFTVTFGPATPVVLLVAGLDRPAGAPRYLPAEELAGEPVPSTSEPRRR